MNSQQRLGGSGRAGTPGEGCSPAFSDSAALCLGYRRCTSTLSGQLQTSSRYATTCKMINDVQAGTWPGLVQPVFWIGSFLKNSFF